MTLFGWLSAQSARIAWWSCFVLIYNPAISATGRISRRSLSLRKGRAACRLPMGKSGTGTQQQQQSPELLFLLHDCPPYFPISCDRLLCPPNPGKPFCCGAVHDGHFRFPKENIRWKCDPLGENPLTIVAFLNPEINFRYFSDNLPDKLTIYYLLYYSTTR